MNGGPSVPAPEEEEEAKPSAALAPAADLAKPGTGRRFRPRVPMTKEEEEKLVELTVRHVSGRKELQARIERRDQLRRRFDELVFKRRCWAATLANHVFTLRADVAHARHQLRVGKGNALPEELEDARRRNHHCVSTMNEHIGKAMDMGLEAFTHDYCKFYEEKNMRCEGDENGVPQGPVASK